MSVSNHSYSSLRFRLRPFRGAGVGIDPKAAFFVHRRIQSGVECLPRIARLGTLSLIARTEGRPSMTDGGGEQSADKQQQTRNHGNDRPHR